MAEQLAIDFAGSSGQRMRRAKAAVADTQLGLFAFAPNLDVHLHSPREAVAEIAGAEPERAERWLRDLVGALRPLRPRRVAFPAAMLDRLLHVVPPAQVTLDASATAVGRALWAAKLGLRPLVVRRDRQRLLASSPTGRFPSWPKGFAVRDVPWPAISAIAELGLPLEVRPGAAALMQAKLARGGQHIATAGLAGSAVLIETSQPQLLERLALPALAYAGEPGAGRYKMPLLAAGCLLEVGSVRLSEELERKIRRVALRPPRPLRPGPTFPWTLYPFQARDAGRAAHILQVTGGVLLAGEMGTGKALADDEPVLTPHGWRPIASLAAGDQVVGTDGRDWTVRGCYRQGWRRLRRVSFGDGASVRCDDEHLWAAGPGPAGPFTPTTTAEVAARLRAGHAVFVPATVFGPAKRIVDVGDGGAGPATCIETSAPDRLYVTAGHTPTHNTTVALAVAEHVRAWPLLIVAPLSAFSTWSRQLGELGRSFYLASEAPARSWAAIESQSHDAVVISYDRLPAFVELIERCRFEGIVADEIQRIRTPGSRRSRALRSLAAAVPRRIGLSGTPLTNRVEDLLPLGAFLAPAEWKPRANTRALADLYPGDPVESIAEHLATMMVRRRMVDVGARLPRRRDHRVYVPLTPEQRRALADLEAEAVAAKEAGTFDEPGSKLHAFVRLQRMRQIIADPHGAGLGGPNPKIAAAVDLAQDFIDQGRKGVIFCADRAVFRELGRALSAARVGWVGIWGSTPIAERVEAERRFHSDPDVKVVLCTIQAGSESWSASPTGTWLITTSYMYAPSTLAQMEARVYRMSSDPNGPDIDICYLHAQAPGGTLDDRFVEILESKKRLFAQVVDRSAHRDSTRVHLSLGDLVFMLTGTRDARLDAAAADELAVVAAEQARKRHARASAHARTARSRSDASLVIDDGSQAATLEEWLDAEDADVASLGRAADFDGDDFDGDDFDGDDFDGGGEHGGGEPGADVGPGRPRPAGQVAGRPVAGGQAQPA